MLVRSFFVLFLIALLSEAIVFGAASLARSEISHRAGEAAQVQIAAGTQAAQVAIATQMAAGNAPANGIFAAPAPITACARPAPGNGCLLSAQTVVTFVTAPIGTSGTCVRGTACTIFVQSNDVVAERRTYAQVTATVTDTGGNVLATRSATVAFRLFDEAPYVAVAGSVNSSSPGLSESAVGDDGGSVSNNTLLHVQYRNSATGSKTSGDVWNAQNQTSTQSAPAWGN